MAKTSTITTCGYIVRKLSKKYGVNATWLWDLLDIEFNMRGSGCAITWVEANDLEQIVANAVANDNTCQQDKHHERGQTKEAACNSF